MRAVLPGTDWHRLVREFFVDHRSTSPYFSDIAEAFIDYLASHDCPVPGAEFVYELAHYEWVELALAVDDSPPVVGSEPVRLVLAEHRPVVTPHCKLLSYRYPVHRIEMRFVPAAPGDQPTFLLVYRDILYAVRFLEISELSARLLAVLMADAQLTVADVTRRIAVDAGLANIEHLLPASLALIRDLHAKGVIVGVRPEASSGPCPAGSSKKA